MPTEEVDAVLHKEDESADDNRHHIAEGTDCLAVQALTLLPERTTVGSASLDQSVLIWSANIGPS